MPGLASLETDINDLGGASASTGVEIRGYMLGGISGLVATFLRFLSSSIVLQRGCDIYIDISLSVIFERVPTFGFPSISSNE